MQRRPDLFVVGAPKSGTTSLYEYLREHPDVYMSEVKEPFYFSPDVFRTFRNKFKHPEDEERYLALFAAATTEKRIGEASTTYLASPAAPRLIHEFAPDAHIICILRDPVEVAYAWHGERVFRGVEPHKAFDRALLDSDDGQKYRQIGKYATQLERWFAEFGRERVHVIVYEDFAADTPAAYRSVLQFLGVDPDFRPASFAAHNTVSGKSRLVPFLRGPLGRRVSAAINRAAGRGIARRLSRAARQLPLRRGRSRPPLDPDLRQVLVDDYRPEVVRAGDLLGRDLVSLWLPQSDDPPRG
jgi:hypothetical protein